MMSFAQDIIVKKDGTTILSKVTEVSDTQVKYKKHSNLDGPTYSVNVIDLQCINYENGEIDKFNSEKEGNAHVSVSDIAHSNTTSFITGERNYSDAELLRMYRGGDNISTEKTHKIGNSNMQTIKLQKKIGVYGGIAAVASGIALGFLGEWFDGPSDIPVYAGLGLIGVGIIGGPCMYIDAVNKEKRIKETMKYQSLYQYNISLGKNTMLAADVNLINDRMTRQQALGLGFHLNF